MDKPIAVGDLVVVVRPEPCGCIQSVGHFFTVVEINEGVSDCVYCGARIAFSRDAYDGETLHSVSTLKRIDPPALPESVESREELTA